MRASQGWDQRFTFVGHRDGEGLSAGSALLLFTVNARTDRLSRSSLIEAMPLTLTAAR